MQRTNISALEIPVLRRRRRRRRRHRRRRRRRRRCGRQLRLRQEPKILGLLQ